MLIRTRRWLTRAVWLKCHLYLALVFGLFFALMGLTGSLSVYRQTIDELFNPSLVIERPQAQALSLDAILVQVRQSHPNRHGAWTREMPRTVNGTITAGFEKPQESVNEFYAPLMVAVNPYTGEVISSRFWGQTLTSWLLDCHTHLQIQATGRDTVAVLAVLLSLSVLSGLYLWWPGLNRISLAFKVRHNVGLMRFVMDLHRVLGLLSAGFLLLLAFTGFHLAYPALLETLTASVGMGHGDEGPGARSTAVPNNRPISIAEALLVARGLFPSSEVRRITTPAGELGTYRINLRQRNELNQHHPFTTVWVDRWSGQIRNVNNPTQFSAGQTFTTWQWPLHTGEAFGDTGRFIWFVMGLMPLILWLSGVLHWLYRKGYIRDRPFDLMALLRFKIRRWQHLSIYYGNKIWRQSYPVLAASLRWIRVRLANKIG
jgi:uncharacterized iron-regulated membrane protein